MAEELESAPKPLLAADEPNNTAALARPCGADIPGPEVSTADVCGADRSGADLSGADVASANLSGGHVPSTEVSVTEVSSAEISNTEVSAAAVSVKEAPRKENRLNERPFRVKLRGSVLALLRLPNRRDVRSAIHQISITGGVVHLEKPLDENLTVEMVFHMGNATIRAKAQLLFPMWATQGWMQPFRFLELSNESRENLGASLKALVGDKTAAAGA
jgi:hypothetical protein